jgi:hypothetical protein
MRGLPYGAADAFDQRLSLTRPITQPTIDPVLRQKMLDAYNRGDLDALNTLLPADRFPLTAPAASPAALAVAMAPAIERVGLGAVAGQGLRNVGKAAGLGAAMGATDSALHGGDMTENLLAAGVGGVAGPIAGKLAGTHHPSDPGESLTMISAARTPVVGDQQLIYLDKIEMKRNSRLVMLSVGGRYGSNLQKYGGSRCAF